MNRLAWLSECGKYRYALSRTWRHDGVLYAFFGINPSTADADIDDATVRKWIGFTERNGGKGFLVESGKPIKIFGKNKSGDPKHPLMLGYDTPLVDYQS